MQNGMPKVRLKCWNLLDSGEVYCKYTCNGPYLSSSPSRMNTMTKYANVLNETKACLHFTLYC